VRGQSCNSYRALNYPRLFKHIRGIRHMHQDQLSAAAPTFSGFKQHATEHIPPLVDGTLAVIPARDRRPPPTAALGVAIGSDLGACARRSISSVRRPGRRLHPRCRKRYQQGQPSVSLSKSAESAILLPPPHPAVRCNGDEVSHGPGYDDRHRHVVRPHHASGGPATSYARASVDPAAWPV